MAEMDYSNLKDVERYELVGVANFLNFYPAFVIPLFKKTGDDCLYMQKGDDFKSLEVTGFYPLTGKSLNSKVVKYLDNMDTNDISTLLEDFSCVGSLAIYAYQTGKNEYLIGRYPEFRELILEHKFDKELFEKLGIDEIATISEIKEYISSVDAIANLK